MDGIRRVAATPGVGNAGTMLFSHANSYPAGTYRRLFAGWADAGVEVAAVERYGHDARYPVGRNWRGMAQQLIDLIDARPEPTLWLVGHSLGGYLSLMAAGKRPARVRGIVLLDAPLVHGWKAGVVSMLKLTGQMRRVSPAAVAEKRRDRWPDKAAAHAHFAAKKLFARWDPAVLADYIEAGTEVDPDVGDPKTGDAAGQARRLAFRRDVESDIYATIPHWLAAWVHRHPPGGPVAFVAGRRSSEIRQAGLGAIRTITHGRISWMEGSHLFPFEQPERTVAEVLGWMRRLRGLQG